MKLRAFAVLGAVGLALAGCGGESTDTPNPPPADGATTSTAGATSSPGGAPQNNVGVPVLAAGVGPYSPGVRVADTLQPGSLIGEVKDSAKCQGYQVANATAPYAQGVTVVIKDGAVAWVEIVKPGVTTPEGATIGSTLAALRSYYETQGGKEIGNGAAFTVPDGNGHTVLFRLDKSGLVTALQAGDAKTLEGRVAQPAGC